MEANNSEISILRPPMILSIVSNVVQVYRFIFCSNEPRFTKKPFSVSPISIIYIVANLKKLIGWLKKHYEKNTKLN